MEVYARLNAIRENQTEDENSIQLTVDQLLKMAKKDRYIFYRDIIYYAAAEIEMQGENFPMARNMLLKSVANSKNNPVQKTKSYLLLADLSYDRKMYSDAKDFYDSLDVSLLLPETKGY